MVARDTLSRAARLDMELQVSLVFFIIERQNEVMAFMTSVMSQYVFAGLAVCAIVTSVCLIIENFREDDRRAAREARMKRRRPKLEEIE